MIIHQNVSSSFGGGQRQINKVRGILFTKRVSTEECYIVIYTFIQHHNDTIIKTHEGRKTKEELRCRKEDTRRLLWKNIHLSLYCKGSKGLLKGLHVRGCWRPNINFIFWPHCYDRHVVSLLFSWCWGPLHRGFPRTASVGCGLPYHISSLTLWESAGNCIGGFPSAPSVGCGLPYHIWSLLSGIRLATAWDPNSAELNNNSTPTRSPTGSLNRIFNRHQAEITVMQFRGYSLPVHDCSGTIRPSPCPIS